MMLRRVVAVASIVTVVSTTYLGAARGAPEGLIITATASGKTIIFDDPDSPIPAEPSMEAHEAYSLATFDSGPSAHGLASIFWPGSAGANFGPVYGLPAYPVRAETFYPKGPARDKNDPGPPGMSMQAQATDVLANAAASSGKENGSPGAVARRLSSSVSSFMEDGGAVSEASATVNDLKVAGGMIAIESVVTEARITSDGTTAKVAGKTKVAGVTIADQFEARIDEKGLHLNDETVEIPDVFGQPPVKDALEAAGVTVKVARPIKKIKGGSAVTELGGLVVRFEAGALEQYLKPLPKEVRDELSKHVDFAKVVVYRFGSVNLGVDANDSAFELPPLQPPDPPPVGPPAATAGGGAPVVGIPGLGGDLPEINPPAAPNQPDDPAPIAAEAPPITGHPLPLILVALTLAGALGSTQVMKRLADQLVGGSAIACRHKDV